MDFKSKNVFLELYGLFRMALGIAQIVGLTTGYFFKEFILNYSVVPSLYVIDKDVVALIYFAVLIRSIFHIIAGIGIARIRYWSRICLLCGWPIVIIITFGLSHALYSGFNRDGYVSTFNEIFSFPKILVYILFVLFDLIIINVNVKDIDINYLKTDDANRIEVKTISLVFFLSILFFSLLLFLGKPIKQGFHNVYYKVGKKKVMAVTRAKLADFEKADTKDNISLSKKSVSKQTTILSSRTRSEKPTDILNKSVKKLKSGGKEVELKVDIELPYKKIIGYLAGFSIIFGLLAQLLNINNTVENNRKLLAGYVLICIGFILWVIFGVSSKITVVSFSNFIASLLCIFIILLIIKNK